MKEVNILGIRGVPAQHGGFETFAEHLCRYLINNGWKVNVYCQEAGSGPIYYSEWEGVNRIHIPVKNEGPLGTILFDLRSVWHSLSQKGIYLTLGYNTAVFNILHRVFNKKNIINMDGIEWKRAKWGKVAKTWFWINERLGCWFGNHLVADHPKIKEHLATRVSAEKITMIPYGANKVDAPDNAVLSRYDLEQDNYGILIARPEPENSVLEIVEAFSRKKRDRKLVVLGNYTPDSNDYHRQVKEVSSEEIIYLGAIYEPEIVEVLRYYARFYVHGHQVGGTNPSLVEALGAGNPVLAHDNHFNRWVAAESALYFGSASEAEVQLEQLFEDQAMIDSLAANAKSNFEQRFRWETILEQYELLMKQHV